MPMPISTSTSTINVYRTMANSCLLLFFLLFLSNSVKGADVPHTKDFQGFERRELDREKEQLFPSIHRTLIEYFRYKLTEFDSIDPPTTALPTSPITAPVLTPPPVNSAPGIVTVPGTNPVGVSSPTPITNPANTPVPVTNPVTTPSTNPVTTPSGGSTMPSPTTSGGNASAGRWCVAKTGASQAALQSGLDYACGIGGADCSVIQQGAPCYSPPTLQNHASFAFNSYYQKNPTPTSCDFGGAAVVTNANPSTGSCAFPSSSSSSPTTPTTQAPVNPTPMPTTSSGSTVPGTQSPPPGFSLGSPDPGTGVGAAFGASPPLMNTASVSNNLRPFIGSLLMVPFIIMMFG